MKRQVKGLVAGVLLLASTSAMAQGGSSVQTLFKGGISSSTGYGAITNKFTNIRGEFSNLAGFYGGWYIDHRFMIGAAAAASTNNLKVPHEYSTDPLTDRTYQYGQFGLMTEYAVASNKPVHLVFQLFAGAGFTLQYERTDWHSGNNNYYNPATDQNWFFVTEPGVQLELNLLKWMRFSPGVSYRASFGSDGKGMQDKDVSDITYSATLKFGKF